MNITSLTNIKDEPTLCDYIDPTAWSANPAVQGGEERLSGYERLKREWPECVRCVEASPFPHSGW
ncbi:hypothetical protein [Candidatus Regiella insecticola]|uniref:hypothetical protein n=1 Tax=Candidatus Regiella insecticola TaxID=138073 RepID=UPI0012FF2CF6|nr:hypothetical protein [Candidatus Regiella insecticola]